MKRILSVVSALLLVAGFFRSVAGADEKKGSGGKLTGEVGVTETVGDGQKESAIFDEYSDRTDGLTGDATLNYTDKKGYHASMEASDIGRDNERYTVKSGRYGEYEIEARYDQTPHNIFYGARGLYSGEGTGSLSLPDSMQQDLERNTTSSQDLVDKLNNQYVPQAHAYSLSTERKTGSATFRYMAFDPVTFRLDVSRQQKDGREPLMGAFGFNSVQELVEPIDYTTDQARLSVEYASRPLVLSASYYLSKFDDDIDSLTWDNALRFTDGPSPGSYPAEGGAFGRMALAPDNIFHGPSAMASIMDLPFDGRLTLNGSWGFMSQNDSLVPYTANTSITGMEGARSFNAADAASLPRDDVDADVQTSLYSAVYTMDPLEFMDLSVKYRYYEYDNDTDTILFPGYVRFDSIWVPGPVRNLPTSYAKQTAGAETGFKVRDDTRLGLDYTWQGTSRDNREVEDQDDNIIGASVDHQMNEWLNLRTAYRRIWRRQDGYDFEAPFVDSDENPTQLPFLRKYDEASRNTNEVETLVTVTPLEKLAVSTTFLLGNSDYTDSAFGLLNDHYYMIGGDVDYSPTKWMNVSTFYTYERHKADQHNRQWTPGSTGDPYLIDTGHDSFSNWAAESEDIVHTVGGQITFTLMPKTVFLDVIYTFMQADGTIGFTSPLGAVAEDATAFVPEDWSDVDDTNLHSVNPRVRYKINKSFDLIVGYLWQKFDFDDFTAKDDGTLVASTADGSYNGAFVAGSWPYNDYEVNLGYATLRYRF